MPRAPTAEPLALVLAPPDRVLAASPADRQALAVRVGAPVTVVLDLAQRGLPVPLAVASTLRRARLARDRLVAEDRLDLEVVEVGGLPWWGGAAATTLATLGALVAAGGALLLGTVGTALLAGLAGGVLLALTVVAARRATREGAHWRDGMVAVRELAARRAVAGPFWDDLTQVRRLTLSSEMPAARQGELWAALDAWEAHPDVRPEVLGVVAMGTDVPSGVTAARPALATDR